MAFEKLQLEMGSKAASSDFPASISLSERGARPAVKISLLPALAQSAGFEVNARYDFMIGTDDDAGKLRIVADKNGRIVSYIVKRSGGMSFHLGFVPAIGTAAHKRVRIGARVVEAGVVEIDLPDFSDGASEPRTAPVAPKLEQKQAVDTVVSYHGVSIDFTTDDESVTYKGLQTEVTARQAILVKLLARPMPAPVAESYIIENLWDKPVKKPVEALHQIISDLRDGLRTVGLELKEVKGVGFQLRDL